MGHYRQCIKCGERFIAQRASRRFCSDPCRLKYHRAVWSAATSGNLSALLRRVADSLDNGQTVRSQVARLRVLLATYDRVATRNETVRYLKNHQRKKASA